MTRYSIVQLAVLIPTITALSACGGETATTHWIGKTYLLDTPAVSSSRWTQPPGFGGDIGAYVPQFLIGIAAGTAGELSVTLTSASSGAQDTCNPTTTVTAQGGTYPNVQITAPAFPIRIYDEKANAYVKATVHDLSLTDILPGDSTAKTGTLTATVDIAELYSLFYQIPNATKDSVCSILANNNVPCQVCAFSNQPYCLTLRAVQIGATESATQVTPISAADIPASCQ